MVLVLFLLVGMTSVFAQKHVSVSGRITDELNEPMIGVSVLEKGTTNGDITDFTRAMTCPLSAVKLTRSRARTPGKRLVISLNANLLMGCHLFRYKSNTAANFLVNKIVNYSQKY